MNEDELRSVRIEVEEGAQAVTDVPDVVASGFPTRWPVVAGAVALVILGGIVLMLRPTGDEAADGTVREVPTTTTTTTVLDEQENPSSTVVPDELVRGTRLIDEPVTSARVVSSRQIEQIVSIGDGFLALPDVESNVVPQMLASLDGLNWFEIETQRFGEDVDSASPSDWFSLLEDGDGVAIVGSRPNESGTLEVLRSNFGQTWNSIDDLGPVESPDRLVVPVAVSDDRVIALELFDALELETSSGQSVEVRIPRVCSDLAAGPVEFSLSNCPEFGIEADAFAPPPQVVATPDCDALTSENGTAGFGLLQLELVEGSPAVELPTASFVSGDFFPSFTDLGSGRVAVFDEGNSAFERCDGSGVFDAHAPGVVIVDVEQNRTFGYPAPAEVAVDIRTRFDKQVLGEVQLLEDRTHVVLSIRGTLWGIDTLTGRWTMLTDSVGDLGFQTPFAPQFAATAGGDRFLRIANNNLAIFEVEVFGDEMIRATATVVPISRDSAEAVISGFGSVLHATDDLIFYTDGITVWRLQIPAVARN